MSTRITQMPCLSQSKFTAPVRITNKNLYLHKQYIKLYALKYTIHKKAMCNAISFGFLIYLFFITGGQHVCMQKIENIVSPQPSQKVLKHANTVAGKYKIKVQFIFLRIFSGLHFLSIVQIFVLALMQRVLLTALVISPMIQTKMLIWS